ncbi:MAG: putative metal-binding motif-containing protein [Nanoarchaeota archaeon]
MKKQILFFVSSILIILTLSFISSYEVNPSVACSPEFSSSNVNCWVCDPVCGTWCTQQSLVTVDWDCYWDQGCLDRFWNYQTWDYDPGYQVCWFCDPIQEYQCSQTVKYLKDWTNCRWDNQCLEQQYPEFADIATNEELQGLAEVDFSGQYQSTLSVYNSQKSNYQTSCQVSNPPSYCNSLYQGMFNVWQQGSTSEVYNFEDLALKPSIKDLTQQEFWNQESAEYSANNPGESLPQEVQNFNENYWEDNNDELLDKLTAEVDSLDIDDWETNSETLNYINLDTINFDKVKRDISYEDNELIPINRVIVPDYEREYYREYNEEYLIKLADKLNSGDVPLTRDAIAQDYHDFYSEHFENYFGENQLLFRRLGEVFNEELWQENNDKLVRNIENILAKADVDSSEENKISPEKEKEVEDWVALAMQAISDGDYDGFNSPIPETNSGYSDPNVLEDAINNALKDAAEKNGVRVVENIGDGDWNGNQAYLNEIQVGDLDIEVPEVLSFEDFCLKKYEKTKIMNDNCCKALHVSSGSYIFGPCTQLNDRARAFGFSSRTFSNALNPTTKSGYSKFSCDKDGDGYIDNVAWGEAKDGTSLISGCKFMNSQTLDCDDSIKGVLVYPGATETCDDRDNNCNGQVDEGDVCKTDYYCDYDSDEDYSFEKSGECNEFNCIPERCVKEQGTDCNDEIDEGGIDLQMYVYNKNTYDSSIFGDGITGGVTMEGEGIGADDRLCCSASTDIRSVEFDETSGNPLSCSFCRNKLELNDAGEVCFNSFCDKPLTKDEALNKVSIWVGEIYDTIGTLTLEGVPIRDAIVQAMERNKNKLEFFIEENSRYLTPDEQAEFIFEIKRISKFYSKMISEDTSINFGQIVIQPWVFNPKEDLDPSSWEKVNFISIIFNF